MQQDSKARSHLYSVPSERNPTNIEGQIYDIIGNRATALSWQQRQGNFEIISGGSNASILTEFRGSIIKLWNDFFSENSSISIASDQKEVLQKRLFLLEHEIDGLLKRKINYTIKDSQHGERVLDYTSLINEKENRIVQLETKIINLEAKLRRAGQREKQLQMEIGVLHKGMTQLEKPSFNKRDIQGLFKGDREYREIQKRYNHLKNQVGLFGGLFASHIAKLKQSGVRFEYERQLRDLLSCEGIDATRVNDAIYMVEYRDRVVNSPVSGQENMEIVGMLAGEIKALVGKYPHLKLEFNEKLVQFMDGDMDGILESMSGLNVVDIVKYVPQVVKVEDVYMRASYESRKIEFHLRILIKALLGELERIMGLTGIALELDEGIIGMIQQEIGDVVNVDDILKIYRSVPKTIEVEKIVEKVVDRVIEVPQIVPVEVLKEVPIEVIRYEEIEKIIHVPVEITKVVDRVVEKMIQVESVKEKVVQVPKKFEVVVERIVEMPKLITQEVFVEKVVEVQKPVIVQQIIHVPEPQPYPVEIIKEKVVQMEVIVEKPVPVDRIVEKIVKVYEHEEHPIEVEKRNDILVKEVEILPAREVVHVVDERTKTVTLENEKIVPFIEAKERIVEVPKIIEKIVEVKIEVPKIVEVPVIEKQIQFKERIKQVEKVVEKIVPVYEEKIKEIERIVEVPIIKERIVKVPEVVTQVVVEKAEIIQPVEVVCQVPMPVEVTKVVEVEKPVVHYIHEEIPVKVKVDNVVPVTKTVERIKEVRVNIDKVIEKMVEVPKVVEVEKIVEKVVVVPRVIEKIVEVPQIVEKVVDRMIETEKIVEVQVESQVPLIKEKQIEIQVQKNFYFTNEVPVEVVRQKVVEKKEVIEKVEVVREYVDNIVETRVEVPRELKVEKVVPEVHQIPKVFEVEKQIIVPVKQAEVVDRIKQKIVPIEKLEEKIIIQVQEVEKIVEVKVEQVRIEVVEEKHEVPIIEKRVEIHKDEIPYIEQRVNEIRTVEEKIVHTQSWREQPKIVECIVEKVVPETVYKHEAHQFQAIKEVLIEVEKVKPVDNIKPVLVENVKVIPECRDVIIEIPLIEQVLKEVKVMEEKVVAIEHEKNEVSEVPVKEEKIVIEQKLVTKTDIKNHIERAIQQVIVHEEKVVPIHSTVQKLVEVPHIMEKIVEKIVLLPQVVEVMKYVHEIVEKDTRVAVDVTVQEQEIKYKQMYRKVQQNFHLLLTELRKLRMSHPGLQAQIQIIEAFLAELNKLIALPRIVQVDKEVAVEVDKRVPVLVSKVDAQAQKHQITLSLIIHRLMAELLRIEQKNPSVKLELDKDLLKIFASDFKYRDFFEGKLNLEDNISLIYNHYDDILKNMGGSTLANDQQLIFTSALQERLINAALIRQANIEIDKVKSISDQRNEAFKLLKQNFVSLSSNIGKLESAISTGNMAGIESITSTLRGLITSQKKGEGLMEPERLLQNLFIHDIHESHVRLDSNFREILKENQMLRGMLIQVKNEAPSITGIQDRDRIIDTLQKRIVELNSQINSLKTQESVSIKISGSTDEYQLKIRTLNSQIEQLQSQIRTIKIDYDGRLRTKDHYIRQMQEKVLKLQEKLRIGDSRVTDVGGGTRYTPSQYSVGQRMTSSAHSQSSAESEKKYIQGTRQYGGTYTSSSLKPEETGSGVSYGGSRVTSGVTSGFANVGTTNVSYGGSRVSEGGSSANYSTSRIGIESNPNMPSNPTISGRSGSPNSSNYNTGRSTYTRTYGTTNTNTNLNQSSQSGSSAQGSVSYGRQYGTTQNEGTSSTSTSGYKYYSGRTQQN